MNVFEEVLSCTAQLYF